MLDWKWFGMKRLQAQVSSCCLDRRAEETAKSHPIETASRTKLEPGTTWICPHLQVPTLTTSHCNIITNYVNHIYYWPCFNVNPVTNLRELSIVKLNITQGLGKRFLIHLKKETVSETLGGGVCCDRENVLINAGKINYLPGIISRGGKWAEQNL